MTAPAFAAGIYKWVDKNGKTHFGDRPPTDVPQSKEVKIRDIPEADRHAPSDSERRARQNLLLQTYGQERAEKKQAAEKKKKERKILVRKCVVAKHKLKQFKQAGYLYGLDDSGNKVIRSDDQRDRAINNLEKAIQKNCK